MHTGTDGVLHLGVPRSEVAGWLVVLLAVAAAGLADLRWGNGALAIACLVVVVVLGGTVVRPVLSAVTAHPEGHLLVRGSLGTARYEMEQIDAVVVAVLGPALGASTWLFRQLDGPRLPSSTAPSWCCSAEPTSRCPARTSSPCRRCCVGSTTRWPHSRRGWRRARRELGTDPPHSGRGMRRIRAEPARTSLRR